MIPKNPPSQAEQLGTLKNFISFMFWALFLISQYRGCEANVRTRKIEEALDRIEQRQIQQGGKP